MYGTIWRLLPGPRWLRAIQALALTLLAIYLLFEFAFPWVLQNTNIVDNTIGE